MKRRNDTSKRRMGIVGRVVLLMLFAPLSVGAGPLLEGSCEASTSEERFEIIAISAVPSLSTTRRGSPMRTVSCPTAHPRIGGMAERHAARCVCLHKLTDRRNGLGASLLR